MNHQAKSVRPFIGAKNFDLSKAFYKDLGFQELVVSPSMSYFNIFDALGFYLQNAYVEDWVNNSMIFVEVDDAERYWSGLQKLELHLKYENVRLTPVRHEDWGSECFLHDPSGVLWHFGTFNQ